jgi:nucleoside-diphosphate-sugar epimerase
VYHNVAQTPLAKDRDLIESVNIGGTANLLRAAAGAGVSKVVFTSSSAIYGVPRSNPVDEDTAPDPAELYGRAKVRAEDLCRRAAADGLDVTIVRPRTVVGHGRLGIFALLFDWVADGADVFVFGKGDNRYQFVHANDLAAACRLAGGRPGATSYNVGAAEFGTMRQVLEALVRHAGTRSRVRSLPVAPAMAAMAGLSKLGLMPFGPYHWLLYGKSLWFDITKARAELGWEPVHSNESMICESYDWFLAHRDELGGAGRSLHQAPVPPGVLRMLKRVGRGGRSR